MCTEVCNSDRTVRTGLLTLLTSDTSKFTGSCNSLAFSMGAAAYESLLLVWCKLDQMMRTFCDTFTAGFTCITVYDCNTVHDMDRIKRTGFYAASESHPYVGTGARDECHHFTVFYTCVSVVVFCLFTGSGTFYESSHTCALDNFLSHDPCDHFSNCFATYRTCIDRCFTFGDRCCQTITARISASTTVVSRKCFTDSNFFLIDFYRKFLAGNAEEDSNKEAHCCNNDSCHDNCINIHNLRLLRYLSSPENPKNAIAIRPAVSSTFGKPWKDSGTSLYSVFSLIPAIRVIEIVNPTAVANPFTVP